MPEIFSDFIYTTGALGLLLGLGIIFEKQLIAFEDKFDAWLGRTKKLKVLEKENKVLKHENKVLAVNVNRLSDSNFDLSWENKKLNVKLMKKEGQKVGEYFYDAANAVRQISEQTINQGRNDSDVFHG